MEALEAIKKILNENDDLEVQIPINEINPDHQYRRDLGLDSLGLMTLAFELQEIYPDLDETEISDWITVEDSLKTLNNL